MQLCLWECPGRTGSGDDQNGGCHGSLRRCLVRVVAGRHSALSGGPRHRDAPCGCEGGPAVTGVVPAYAGAICVKLRCAELRPVRFDVRLRGADLESLVIIACENGALAHGIVPAWYDSRRLASMAEIVTQLCGLNAS